MRTARSLTVFPGSLLSWGWPRLGEDPLNPLPPIRPGDLSHDSFDVTTHAPPPPPNVEQTDASENITFTRYDTRAVISSRLIQDHQH